MKKVCLLLVALSVLNCKEDTHKPAEETDTVKDTTFVETDTIYIETYRGKPIKTAKQLKKELTSKGYQTFDYVDEKTKDTVLMQQYFIAFLKTGPVR